jgi:5-methylcytosine-specific restriction endonuclease McrA
MRPWLCFGIEGRGRDGAVTAEGQVFSSRGGNTPCGVLIEMTAAEADPGLLHLPVLVLNASYEPVNITPVRRAVVLVFKGVATAEEEDGAFIHSARVSFRVPSVIRLLEFRRIPHQSRALSRKNILLRDRYSCQFCGRVLPASELTLDHVVPRSRGGRTDWDNLVACCHPCNNRKGDRLPEEAGLTLLRVPRPFSLHTSRQLMRMMGKSDERWRKYLFY